MRLPLEANRGSFKSKKGAHTKRWSQQLREAARGRERESSGGTEEGRPRGGGSCHKRRRSATVNIAQQRIRSDNIATTLLHFVKATKEGGLLAVAIDRSRWISTFAVAVLTMIHDGQRGTRFCGFQYDGRREVATCGRRTREQWGSLCHVLQRQQKRDGSEQQKRKRSHSV